MRPRKLSIVFRRSPFREHGIKDLANASGLTVRTLARIESSQTIPRQTTLQALAEGLEAAGIEFISENGGGPGVRLSRRLNSK
ncbi:MAG: XRE family transcriptional regulator [Mesorhizobium sp.]|nr:MAG: XRE family transcriptional regulator [Mesorhizobium sp.]